MSQRQPPVSTLEDAERSDPPRSDLVPIRLPTGERAWVTPDAFNLISEKEFQESGELRRLRRQRDLATTVAGVALFVLVVGSLAWLARGGRGSAAAGSQEAIAGSAQRSAAESATVPPPPSPQAPAELAAVEETVRAWAHAWSAQDVDGYLGFYARSFQPPDGLDRAAWEARRRERITGPRRIEVAVSAVETALTGAGTAVARFAQAYRAPGYRDWVHKTFELVSEEGRWRIVEERSAPLPGGDVLPPAPPG